MTLLATVDEIEGNLATLLLRRDDDEVPLGVFSLSELPKGVKAGDILNLSFSINVEETNAAKERVRRLRDKLLRK